MLVNFDLAAPCSKTCCLVIAGSCLLVDFDIAMDFDIAIVTMFTMF